MRTTLDIDEDVLQAAKELGEFRGVPPARSVRPRAESTDTDGACAEGSQRRAVAAGAARGGPLLTRGSSMSCGSGVKGPALLDVNVLVARVQPDHPDHEVVHAWFADTHMGGWATFP